MSDMSYVVSEPPFLPPQNTQRWVKSRKIAIIKAIDSGALTDIEACERYGLSQEELNSWKHALREHGPGALRTTHLNRYRRDPGHPEEEVLSKT